MCIESRRKRSYIVNCRIYTLLYLTIFNIDYDNNLTNNPNTSIRNFFEEKNYVSLNFLLYGLGGNWFIIEGIRRDFCFSDKRFSEKSFLNLVKLNQISIAIELFRLICCQIGLNFLPHRFQVVRVRSPWRPTAFLYTL